MLQLYFSPMACSLASRIALMEAGIEARYHLVHLWTRKVVDDDSDFRGISPMGGSGNWVQTSSTGFDPQSMGIPIVPSGVQIGGFHGKSI